MDAYKQGYALLTGQAIELPMHAGVLSNDQLYAKLGALKRELPPDEFEALQEKVLSPYRRRNFALGTSLVSFCLLVFVYSMYKTKTDDFSNVAPSPLTTVAKNNQ
ncbi:hypothetical protein HDU76_012726 [Blyttiomyces sp. JEL0837]|nr:hypothetical protein HDU76_012726 [Blyttiomyces sp. JEL0837]